MISKIIEKQFIVLWFTLIACVLGFFSYQKMPIELLPASQEHRFAVVVPNPGMAPRELMALVSTPLGVAARLQGLKADMQLDANTTRFVAVFNPSHADSDKNVRHRFQDELKKQFDLNHILLPAQIISLGMHQSPVITLMIRTDILKLSPHAIDEIRNSVLQISGIERVTQVGKLESPVLGLVPTLNESAQHTIKNRGEFVSFFQHSLAPRPVLQSSFNTTVASGFETSEEMIKSVEKAFREAPGTQSELTFFDGHKVELINIFRLSSKNDLDVSDRIRNWLKTFQIKHPELEISVVWDVADYIRAADKNVSENLRDGTLLTCLCVYLFIRRFGQTFLVSVSIPISILVAFPLLSLAGISRNIMSLAGIALAVGIVVDTTLSVIGEMVSQLQTGRSTQNAALRAARLNFKPVLLTSLSSLAVFLPILFLDGFVGTLFYDLSMTFIIAQLTSFVVSIFIMPVVAATYYSIYPPEIEKVKIQEGRSWTHKLGDKVIGFFEFILISPTRSLVLSVGFLVMVGLSLLLLPSTEFLPQSRANQFRLSVFTNPLLTEPQKIEVADKTEHALTKIGATSRKIHWTGSLLKVDFKTATNIDLEATNLDFQKTLRPFGTRLSRFSPFDLAASDGRNIEFFVDLDGVKREEIKQAIANLPGVRGQHWSNDFLVPTLEVNNWGTAHAASFGLPRTVLADAWPLIYGTIPMGTVFDKTINQYRLVTLNANSNAFHALPNTSLFTDKTQLSNLFPRVPTESHVYWTAGQNAEKVEITTAPGQSGTTHAALSQIFKSAAIKVMWDSDTSQNQQSMTKLFYCLVIAIILITLLLYMQQRSLFLTIAVLFTFIWAPAGAIPGLWLHNELLNGSALVGFILLAGSVVNNGILVVEMIQKHRLQQMSPAQACVLAIRERSLNVIITSLTTVFGMLPLVFETGTGSEMYRGLAIVVVYGVLVSTPMSLIGVPCLVILFDEVKERLHLIFLKIRIFAFHREVHR